MIAYLQGMIRHKSDRTLTLDVQGVGYEVCVSPEVLAQARIGSPCELFTFLHVKENLLELYGFSDLDEKFLFEQLTSLSGIGPRSARNILNHTGSKALYDAIQSRDTTMLTVKGIGRKTAEKIVSELKDTLLHAEAGGTHVAHHTDLVEALRSLGYTHAQIRQVMEKIPKDVTDTQEQIKIALKSLS